MIVAKVHFLEYFFIQFQLKKGDRELLLITSDYFYGFLLSFYHSYYSFCVYLSHYSIII